MAVERNAVPGSLVEVVDRVLDKGLVIDAFVRVSLVGIELLRIEARVVVASIATYLQYAAAIGTVQVPEPKSLSDDGLTRTMEVSPAERDQIIAMRGRVADAMAQQAASLG